jgi:hypothetical protein
MHQTFTQGHVNVFDKYLHWAHVSLKCFRKRKHCNRIIVSVNDLNLHEIYMPYIWLLALTSTTLVFTRRVKFEEWGFAEL